MSDAFIGEIRIFGSNYVPEGWLVCDGKKYATSSYPALYSVVANTFGGDRNNFALPDLRGQAVIAPGLAATGGAVTRQYGIAYGAPTVTLSSQTLPAHSHQLQRKATKGGYNDKTAEPSVTSDLSSLSANATTPVDILQNTGTPNTILSGATIEPAGQINPSPHDNLQPYVAFIFGINYDGVYPVKGD